MTWEHSFIAATTLDVANQHGDFGFFLRGRPRFGDAAMIREFKILEVEPKGYVPDFIEFEINDLPMGGFPGLWGGLDISSHPLLITPDHRLQIWLRLNHRPYCRIKLGVKFEALLVRTVPSAQDVAHMGPEQNARDAPSD